MLALWLDAKRRVFGLGVPLFLSTYLYAALPGASGRHALAELRDPVGDHDQPVSLCLVDGNDDARSIAGDVEVLVGLAGLVDAKKENERIERGVKKLDKDIAVLEKRLSSENFVKNAPPDVVAEARAQLEQQKRQRERLLEALPVLLADHQPQPSLLHGDLWGGNWLAGRDGTPWIFDPCVYYGDREADIAMTHLFGGFGASFYRAYESAWPLPPGHEVRRDLYNLYHVINHANLFGGGYAQQAYGFNYYGTVGANRDEFVIVRKMDKVDWLERPPAEKEGGR